ncbi:Uncharacterized protein DAT39_005012 [Clarias magur]|uniref:Uncharacterized protein n=1 Tax=Clarias magur TaxID=1594786 RepID=A0A8J4XFN2_CLAMG|nr:Uncharacterized protein DAT39_005012 [Clarias magur]
MNAPFVADGQLSEQSAEACSVPAVINTAEGTGQAVGGERRRNMPAKRRNQKSIVSSEEPLRFSPLDVPVAVCTDMERRLNLSLSPSLRQAHMTRQPLHRYSAESTAKPGQHTHHSGPNKDVLA